MKELALSKRLSAAASFVSDGAIVADIGTDHAYIPINLILSGKASYAIASDVNEGPIAIAKENIEKYGVSDKITVRVADGLCGIEEFKPDCIIICGMGGELIVNILKASEYVKSSNVKLVLQPMTAVKELREYLADGFEIEDEKIVYDASKLYQVICARYDGKKHVYTNAELELGKINIAKKEPLFKDLLCQFIKKKNKRLNGLKEGGYPTDEIEEEIKELESML